jgi:hypothetical protein
LSLNLKGIDYALFWATGLPKSSENLDPVSRIQNDGIFHIANDPINGCGLFYPITKPLAGTVFREKVMD